MLNIDEIMYEKCDFFTKISKSYDIPMSEVVHSYEKIFLKYDNNTNNSVFLEQHSLIEYIDFSFEIYAKEYDENKKRYYCFLCKKERKMKNIDTRNYNGEVIIREQRIYLSCGHKLSIKISNTFDD